MARFSSLSLLNHSRRLLHRFSGAGLLLLLGFPILAGCASLNAYRAESVLIHSRFTTIENYANSWIDSEQVDQLLLQVAEILGVRLDPAVLKPRIVVTDPERIARFYTTESAAFPGHVRAAALYFPGTSLILIPYFDRTYLGHELAHYFSDHYLKAPRAEWEDIAHSVEWKLLTAKPVATGTLAKSDGAIEPIAHRLDP